MCGHGFMLGPGMAELIYRLITESYNVVDPEILRNFDPYRDFKGQEIVK
jgi:sarcosine oxidase subunit beta